MRVVVTVPKLNSYETVLENTVGLLVEVVIKVLQTIIGKDDNIIKGTGSNSSRKD